jgi:hypothetical protein
MYFSLNITAAKGNIKKGEQTIVCSPSVIDLEGLFFVPDYFGNIVHSQFS